MTTETAWLAARRKGITASDAAAVLGASPWKSPFQLYLEKRGEIEEPDLSENPRVKAGRLLEPVIAAWFSDEEGYALENPGRHTLQRHPSIPWALCTLDRSIVGKVVDPDDGKPGVVPFEPAERGVLECKTTDARNADDWAEDPPLIAQVQTQWQLAVTDRRWGYIAGLIGGNVFRSYRVERDDGFVERMFAAAEKFWARVQKGDPPPIDGSEATADVLKRLYRVAVPGKAVDLSSEIAEVDRRLQDIRKRRDSLEREETACRNKIVAALADAEVGMLPDGTTYTFRTVERPAHMTAASTYRRLNRQAPKGDRK